MSRVTWLSLVVILLCRTLPGQNAITVFQGIPSVKISEGGDTRLPETLTRAQAVNVACTISKIGNRYYWASRENKTLIRIEAGSFTTFLAEDGSGYVRFVTDSNDRKLFKFAYVEHLLIGLNSVTYYGLAK